MSDMTYVPNINVQIEGIDVLNQKKTVILFYFCHQQSTNSQPDNVPTVYQLSINNWSTDVDTMHTMGMNCHKSTYTYKPVVWLLGFYCFL